MGALLKAGYTHVVDADIQSYFDTIDHDLLIEEVKREIADGRVLDLVKRYLQQQVLEESKVWTPEAGTPQGAVISPLLANIYLHSVDMALKAAGYEMVRYADDLRVTAGIDAYPRLGDRIYAAPHRFIAARQSAVGPSVEASLPAEEVPYSYFSSYGYLTLC